MSPSLSPDSAHPSRSQLLVGTAAALATGALYAASLPPLSYFPLAWIALVPLLIACRSASRLQGAWFGFAFAMSATLWMTLWLPGATQSFFALPRWEALLVWLAACAYCGVSYAAFGAFVAALGQRGRFGPLAIAAAWSLAELYRVYGPVPTLWGLIGYSQPPWLTVIQVADLVGVVGLGALIAAVNTSITGLLIAAPPARARLRGPALRRAAGVAALFVSALGYGALRLSTDFGSGEAIEVAVVQGALPREQRLAPERRAANTDHYLALTHRALVREPTLILWPELALRFHFQEEPAAWARVIALSRSFPGELLLGAPHGERLGLLREERNAAFLLRAGRIVDRHDKLRLMPFSEERPAWLPLGRDAFRPGRALHPLATAHGGLGVLLCSELLHPDLARGLTLQGAVLLSNPSNDDWFATQGAAEHQVSIAVLRAVENRRPLLRPSTTGRSAVIDASGRILALAAYREPGATHAQVRAGDTLSFFSRTSNWLIGALSLILVVYALAKRDEPARPAA